MFQMLFNVMRITLKIEFHVPNLCLRFFSPHGEGSACGLPAHLPAHPPTRLPAYTIVFVYTFFVKIKNIKCLYANIPVKLFY